MISQCQNNFQKLTTISTQLLHILGNFFVLKKSSPEEVVAVINVEFIYGRLLGWTKILFLEEEKE